jgi:GntR family transcriptional regulator, vanillate catabolism transcriptional regulator
VQSGEFASRGDQPPESVSQTGSALFRIRELLLRGEFSGGERISELPLVARLGVSRTPIRLALERLANEGLLEALPSGGFLVRQFDLADVWDAIEMRGVLEGTAARLAAERLSSRDELQTIRAHQSRMDSLVGDSVDSFAVYMDLNEAFHAALVDLAKSPMLRRSVAHVMAIPFASPSAAVYARSRLPKDGKMSALAREHHHSILEAITHRQGARAEALAREHALLARRHLEMALTDEKILISVPGASLINLRESHPNSGSN